MMITLVMEENEENSGTKVSMRSCRSSGYSDICTLPLGGG